VTWHLCLAKGKKLLEKNFMAGNRSAEKRETLNLRIMPEDLELIARAAQFLGKTRTEFLLEAGRGPGRSAGSRPVQY